MPEISPTWRVLPPAVREAGEPIIVFNKSHSGSRLLARLLSEAGVFLGSHVNESYDSEDVFELVEYLVTRYYPDYRQLWRPGFEDTRLSRLIAEVFTEHLKSLDARDGPWGWKLCETAYVLPVLDDLFPGAKYVHIIRDGRDVAFCDHVSPHNAFWKKIYFNTDAITRWRGRSLSHGNYRRKSYLYNAVHWYNSVTIGRAYGSMLKNRYLEVRYEDLCNNFVPTVEHLFAHLNINVDPEFLAGFSREIYSHSVGKYRRQPRIRRRRVLRIIEPLLLSLGYV